METVKLALTYAEKTLLLQMVARDKMLQKALRFSQIKGDLHHFVLTFDEAESLGNLVMDSLEKSPSDSELFELESLLQTIADAVMEHLNTKPMDESNIPPEMHAAIKRITKEMPLATVDEINAALAKEQEIYNNTGQKGLQGLSPAQAHKILYIEMNTPGSGIQLNSDIPIGDFGNSPFLNNSRILLRAAVGGLPVTALGNLNRKSTKMLLDNFAISEEERKDTLRFNKVINEKDALAVHITRIICELAGLVKIRKGAFRITKLGQDLLAEDEAGKLFALLFLAYFREFNLGYVDGCPELPAIQDTIGYSLYVASKMDKWTEMESASEIVFLPALMKDISVNSYVNQALILAKKRLVIPLEAFGLMECEIGETLPFYWKDITRIRKTKLFDRFIHFELGTPQKYPRSKKSCKPRLH